MSNDQPITTLGINSGYDLTSGRDLTILRRGTAEERAIAKWDAGADRFNKWTDLGQDEKDALVAVEVMKEDGDDE